MLYSRYKFKGEIAMDNNIKFTVALENLNNKIAELNIKISEDFDNEDLKNKLSILLNERNTLLKETNSEIIESLINKYGNR